MQRATRTWAGAQLCWLSGHHNLESPSDTTRHPPVQLESGGAGATAPGAPDRFLKAPEASCDLGACSPEAPPSAHRVFLVTLRWELSSGHGQQNE